MEKEEKKDTSTLATRLRVLEELLAPQYSADLGDQSELMILPHRAPGLHLLRHLSDDGALCVSVTPETFQIIMAGDFSGDGWVYSTHNLVSAEARARAMQSPYKLKPHDVTRPRQ